MVNEERTDLKKTCTKLSKINRQFTSTVVYISPTYMAILGKYQVISKQGFYSHIN